MTKIIGITGYKRSGKGEVGKAILSIAQDHVKHAIDFGFADKVKIAACKALGLTDLSDKECVAYMDEFKERGLVTHKPSRPLFRKLPDGEWEQESIITLTITGREFLQFLGTEVGRDVFGDNFWVDQVLPRPTSYTPVGSITPKEYDRMRVSAMYPGVDFIAITDMRFPNEAQRVLDLGGEVWKVTREGTGGDGHSSEAGLPDQFVTRVIENNGTLMDLRYEVERALGL